MIRKVISALLLELCIYTAGPPPPDHCILNREHLNQISVQLSGNSYASELYRLYDRPKGLFHPKKKKEIIIIIISNLYTVMLRDLGCCSQKICIFYIYLTWVLENRDCFFSHLFL